MDVGAYYSNPRGSYGYANPLTGSWGFDAYAGTSDTGDEYDTEGIFGDIVSAVGSVGKTIGGAIASAAETAAQVGIGFATLNPDTIAKGVRELTRNPLWDVVQTGAAFIPGVGTVVSAGMATTAAIGQGKALKDVVLAAGRGALPGGPAVAAAFDVGVGLAKGKKLSDAAIAAARKQVPGGAAGRAAFDAAHLLAKGKRLDDVAFKVARARFKRPAAVAAFDAVVRNARAAKKGRKIVTFPALTADANRVARTIQIRPGMRRASVNRVATATGVSPMEVRDAFSAFLRRASGEPSLRWQDVGGLESFEECCSRHGIDPDTAAAPKRVKVRLPEPRRQPKSRLRVKLARRKVSRAALLALYRRGGPNVQKALLAHGMLAKVSKDTGELTEGARWAIRAGDYPSAIAAKLTGNGNRWREMVGVNPGMTIYTDAQGRTQVKPWQVGQVVNVPPAWIGAPSPAPAPVAPAPAPAPIAPGSRTYTIARGDAPYQVAQRLTGNAGRWKELVDLNPGMTIYTDAQGRTQIRPWQVGQVIRVWGGAAEPPAPVPPPRPSPTPGPTPPSPTPGPTPPSPTPGPTPPGPVLPPPWTQDKPDPAVALIQIQLATVYAAHGAEIGSTLAPPFGLIGDLAGIYSPRSVEAMSGFQRWFNARRGGKLATDGQPDAATIAALDATLAALPAPPGPAPVPPGPKPPAPSPVGPTPGPTPPSPTPPSPTPGPSAPAVGPVAGTSRGIGPALLLALPFFL